MALRGKVRIGYTPDGKPISKNVSGNTPEELEMLAADCVQWRTRKPNTNRENDILKCIKPLITPHYFRHNYVTMLYEAGVDPLIAMKIVGHTDYQTTANIYTHIRDEMLKKATVDLEGVFKKRAGKE